MTYTQINGILNMLNATCQKSLQMANMACLTAGHEAVDISHWLLQLLLLPESDFYLLLQHAQINISELMIHISNYQAQFKKTTVKTPILSVSLKELLKESFCITKLEYHAEQIRSGFVLFTLLDSDHLFEELSKISRLFAQLRKEQLRAEFSTITSASCENEKSSWKPNVYLSKTPSALANFTDNLTQLAYEQKLDPVIGSDRNIRQLIDILMRRRQNNPILVGDPGVGKTAIVEGLAQRILANSVPTPLHHITIHRLDIPLLMAGVYDKGELALRLHELLQEIKAADPPIILFIDEAHALLSSGPKELIQTLKPLWARGELRTIAATTWAEYKQYWEGDAALNRRFQLIRVAEPDEQTTQSILLGLKPSLEQHHQVTIGENSIVAAVQLSRRYITDRQLPDKAINLLDTACARLALMQTENVADPNENEICDTVDAGHIAAVIADWTSIPLSCMQDVQILSAVELEQQFQQHIIGQPYALQELARNIQIAHTRLANLERPAGVFLLVGPSGVGKTATAQMIAELLYGGVQNMTTIHLTEFHEAFRASQLLGSPPGYIGFGEGALLTDVVRRQPYSLILIDDWEKAHPQIQAIFLQIFDKGLLTDSRGQPVSFKNTLFILTSQVCSDLITRLCSNDENPKAEILLHAIHPELQSALDASFLGRVTIIPYYPLSTDALRQITILQLQKIQQQVAQQYQTALTYDEQVIDFILASCCQDSTGARRIIQLLSSKLLPMLAEEFLVKATEQKIITHLFIHADMEKGSLFLTSN